jgi:hypothetical protein
VRVLTVRQPWAWAIVHGGKDVENRGRNIAGGYRGPVAIHAGLAPDFAAASHELLQERWSERCEATQPYPPRFPSRGEVYHEYGAIIGVVDLVDVHRPLWDNTCEYGSEGACSPWAEVDGWPCHLVLANPRPLVEPIPFRGALGLRELPADVEALVRAGVSA